MPCATESMTQQFASEHDHEKPNDTVLKAQNAHVFEYSFDPEMVVNVHGGVCSLVDLG